MNPIIKYRGGKSREIPYFERYIPNDYNRYVEPFFGGGAVFFYLEPEVALINDLNNRLMNFYKEVRNNFSEIRVQLDQLQEIYDRNQLDYKKRKVIAPDERVPNDNEDLYYKMRELFNYPESSKYSDGVLYYFINKTAYSGMIRYNSKCEYNVPFGRYPSFNTKLVTKEHSILLNRAEIFSTDYIDIFNQTQENDFIFLDPPYDCVFNDYGNIDMMNGFDEEEHRRLAADFRNLGARTMMIIGKTELTEELYREYIIDEYYKSYSVNIRNRFSAEAKHIVVTNY